MQETLYAMSGSGKICFTLTREQADSVHHSGQCDDDVAALLADPAIAAQLADINDETLRDELSEYGAWEDDELQDRETNLARIVWLLASDAAENAFMEETDC